MKRLPETSKSNEIKYLELQSLKPKGFAQNQL